MSFLKDLVQSDSTGAEMSDPARARSRDLHHRVRSIQEYREQWTHMMENPVRKGLVTQWEDWAWRGEFTISRGRRNKADAEHRVPTD